MGWHIITDPTWVGPWVAERINGSHQPGGVCIGLSNDGLSLVAGVLYEQWNGRSIVAHIAIDGRITAAFLAAIFHYPFIHCGAEKIICPIASENARSIRLASHMGFVHEATLKDAQPVGHILLFTLTKSDCRFLGEKFLGKIRTTSPGCA